jgi:FHS family L-fucose permease-like MFS transporter
VRRFIGEAFSIDQGICDIDLTNPAGIFGISWTRFSYVVPLVGFAYLGFFMVITVLNLKKARYRRIETEGGGH